VDAFERADGLVRIKRAHLFYGAFAMLFLSFAPITIVGFGAGKGFVFVLAAWMAAWCGQLYAWNRWRAERRGRIRADARGLHVDDALVVAREAIAHAYIHRAGDAWFVRLARTANPVDVRVEDEAAGRALLEAMRLDPAHSVARFTMAHGTYKMSFVRALFAGPAPAALVVTAALAGLAPFGILVGALATVLFGFAYAADNYVRVAVGADGVRFRSALGRARFTPFASIASIDTDGRDVIVLLHDGTRIAVHHSSGKGWKRLEHEDRPDDARHLVARIREGMAASTRRDDAPPSVARRGRSAREWAESVARVSDEHASFREHALPVDALWCIVEDASADATARAGAAVALREGLDDAGRAKLRVVADACAAPRLRVALEAVADAPDEDALLEALDPLHDEPSRLRLKPEA
jgi:hypothetical protein